MYKIANEEELSLVSGGIVITTGVIVTALAGALCVGFGGAAGAAVGYCCYGRQRSQRERDNLPQYVRLEGIQIGQ